MATLETMQAAAALIRGLGRNAAVISEHSGLRISVPAANGGEYNFYENNGDDPQGRSTIGAAETRDGGFLGEIPLGELDMDDPASIAAIVLAAIDGTGATA